MLSERYLSKWRRDERARYLQREGFIVRRDREERVSLLPRYVLDYVAETGEYDVPLDVALYFPTVYLVEAS